MTPQAISAFIDLIPCRSKRSSKRFHRPECRMSKHIWDLVERDSLVQDLPCKILSELPLKEVVRASVLSSRWRCVQKLNPKLRFDGTKMCSSKGICGSKQYTQEFIQNVNALNSKLVVHLDSWVRFVVASQAKNLAIDLVPVKFPGRNDRYLLPNELLDIRTASRLQHIQLGFVSIRLPSQFSGFPNLRKLDLDMINVTAKDIEEMLSSCSNLEWLCIVRCHLDDELKVDLPLPCLLYLCVAHCRITGIKFNAMKLQTFECRGGRYPLDLTQSLELKDARLDFIDSVTLDYALTTLPTVLPSVENLILRARAPLKMSATLFLASFFRAAPLMEKLELHFSHTCVSVQTLTQSPTFAKHSKTYLMSLPGFPHNHLKNLYITGFIACTGQLEFLQHAVENAPVLEVLTLDPALKFDEGMDYKGRAGFFSRVREISRRYLSGRVSPTTKLCIL
uniref:At1g61320/AtMIF1 LRR domain-containing protein n=1 Tax=Setaria italica TaxID=4555 RepID=K3Y2F1_SETIT